MPKTDESHQFKKNTNEVGGLGKPLGKPPAPFGSQSPLAASASGWRDSWGGGVACCPPPRGGTLSDCATPTPAGRADVRLRRRAALEDKGSGLRHGLDLVIVPVNIRQSYSILAGVGMVFRWFFDTDSFPGGGDAGVIITLTTSVIDVIADKQILDEALALVVDERETEMKCDTPFQSDGGSRGTLFFAEGVRLRAPTTFNESRMSASRFPVTSGLLCGDLLSPPVLRMKNVTDRIRHM